MQIDSQNVVELLNALPSIEGKLIEIFGCSCSGQTELLPLGRICSVHAWLHDAKAFLYTIASTQQREAQEAVQPPTDGEIQKLVEAGRQIIAARAKKEEEARLATEQENRKAWGNIINEVSQQLPPALAPFLIYESRIAPQWHKENLGIEIEGFAPIRFCVEKCEDAWKIGMLPDYWPRVFAIAGAERDSLSRAIYSNAMHFTDAVEEALAIAYEQGQAYQQIVEKYGHACDDE